MKYYTLRELEEYWDCMKIAMITIPIAWVIKKIKGGE